MRDELRAALDRLTAALEAHAEAAAAVSRPDIPDPLPQANDDLVVAVAAYREAVDHWTGAHVPLHAPAPPVEGPHDDEAAPHDDNDEDDTAPHTDDVDWAGDAERWR